MEEAKACKRSRLKNNFGLYFGTVSKCKILLTMVVVFPTEESVIYVKENIGISRFVL